MLQEKIRPSTTLERRQYDRFRAKDNAVVVIPNPQDDFYGFLLDISKGGVSFEYIPFDEPIKNADEMDIILDGTGIRFSQLPIKSVSDFEIQDDEYSPVKMRRRSVQFLNLTAAQAESLENFINSAALELSRAN